LSFSRQRETGKAAHRKPAPPAGPEGRRYGLSGLDRRLIRRYGTLNTNWNHHHYLQEEQNMTLEEKVIDIIMEQLGVTKEECVPEASFVDDLGADSLDIVELIMEMEENFGIQIADEELEKIRTIQDVIDFLKSKGVK
jgi:acyl carrier protein